MDKKKLRIVFMGTPEFAVPSLEKLLQSGHEIVGVITAPDKAAGRGLQLQQSAVKKFAVEKGLNILQPAKLRDPGFLDQLRSLNADLQVVVAFRMLPEVVWNMPPVGTINLHASLLPQYRGAAPINWAIINGEKETGVTTFKLKHEIDTGNILLRERVQIGDDETAGELHDRMKSTGAELLLKTVEGLADGSISETTQDENTGELKHAPKLTSETSRINWTNKVEDVFNLVRGLSPYPAAYTLLNGKTMKIFRSKKELVTPEIAVGEFKTDKTGYLKFACLDGYIHVTDLQLEGKKRMSIEDFLRGYRF